VIEEHPEGRTLVVTGAWSAEARAATERRDVDGVWLNYARGYSEPDLSFLDAWPIKRLDVLDRTITDLAPLARLGQTLEALSLQAAPGALIDLATLPHLRSLAAAWDVVRDTLYAPEYLGELIVFDYEGIDLDPLTVQPSLQKIHVKVARKLETLDSIDALPTLTSLRIAAAPDLHDIDALTSVKKTLRELDFEGCPDLYDIEALGTLGELRYLGISDCGRILSFHPIGCLALLETLYAWGSTRVEDCDLSPLLRLRRLTEIRMRDRREYQPRLVTVKEQLGCA
jgi:internalin A